MIFYILFTQHIKIIKLLPSRTNSAKTSQKNLESTSLYYMDINVLRLKNIFNDNLLWQDVLIFNIR